MCHAGNVGERAYKPTSDRSPVQLASRCNRWMQGIGSYKLRITGNSLTTGRVHSTMTEEQGVGNTAPKQTFSMIITIMHLIVCASNM